jgi:ABC-2 type transport system permease protein
MTATTMEPTRVFANSVPSGHYSMMDLVRAEWTKLRTVRSTMWTLGLVVVLGVGLSAIATAETTSHWATMDPGSRGGFDPTQTSLIGVAFAQLVIGILGVLVISGEYGTGTIRATLSAAPARWRVLVAKAGVFGAVALVVSETVSFVAYFLGQALLKAPTPHTTLASPQALRAVVGAGLYLTVLGLFALGLATIIRHTAGGISAFVGVLLVIPLISGALPQSIQQTLHHYLPANIGNQLTQFQQGPTADAFSPWVGFAILCGYALAALVIGGILLNRRDA